MKENNINNDESFFRQLSVTPGPHLHKEMYVPDIMMAVVLALLPASIFSVWIFGFVALKTIILSVTACIVFEKLAFKMFNTKGNLKEYSAVVTGLLLAMNLPPNSPWWLIVIGSAVAMLLGKHVYGGLGHNPFNPVLVSRVFLLISWPVEMTAWTKADGTSAATPLAMLKNKGLEAIELKDLVLGTGISGSLGELTGLLLLAGAGYLFYKKIITWEIPVSFIGSIIVFTGLFYYLAPSGSGYIPPLYHVFSGGLILGAFFMATDMVTNPITSKGMIIFGIGCGVITAIIRIWGAYPEGVSFAILIMNAVTPLINKYTSATVPFGSENTKK